MSEIKTIGVAGCGTMGAGIAIVAARAGFRRGSNDGFLAQRFGARDRAPLRPDFAIGCLGAAAVCPGS